MFIVSDRVVYIIYSYNEVQVVQLQHIILSTLSGARYISDKSESINFLSVSNLNS